MPEDAVELVIIPPDTYQRARDTATERRDTALRGWLMRRNPNPITAAAHFVTQYMIPVVAVVVVAALHSGSTDTSAVAFVLVLPAVLIAVLLVRFVVPDALKRRLPRRLRVEVQPAETTDPTAAVTNSETIPLQYFRHAPPGVWTGATAHCMSAGRRVNATDARSMITHAWRQFSYGLRQLFHSARVGSQCHVGGSCRPDGGAGAEARGLLAPDVVERVVAGRWESCHLAEPDRQQ